MFNYAKTLLGFVELGLKNLDNDGLFWQLVKECLIFFNMSDADLAGKLPVSRSTVSRWRNGVSIPLPVMRKPVYKLFERKLKETLSPSYLFPTTKEQIIKAAQIVSELYHPDSELSEDFLADWLVLAIKDKGVFELGELLCETDCSQEYVNLINSIEKIIEENKKIGM